MILRFLIVDDTKVLRKQIIKDIKKIGQELPSFKFNFVEAAGCDAAIKAYGETVKKIDPEQPFDIVLMDFSLVNETSTRATLEIFKNRNEQKQNTTIYMLSNDRIKTIQDDITNEKLNDEWKDVNTDELNFDLCFDGKYSKTQLLKPQFKIIIGKRLIKRGEVVLGENLTERGEKLLERELSPKQKGDTSLRISIARANASDTLLFPQESSPLSDVQLFSPSSIMIPESPSSSAQLTDSNSPTLLSPTQSPAGSEPSTPIVSPTSKTKTRKVQGSSRKKFHELNRKKKAEEKKEKEAAEHSFSLPGTVPSSVEIDSPSPAAVPPSALRLQSFQSDSNFSATATIIRELQPFQSGSLSAATPTITPGSESSRSEGSESATPITTLRRHSSRSEVSSIGLVSANQNIRPAQGTTAAGDRPGAMSPVEEKEEVLSQTSGLENGDPRSATKSVPSVPPDAEPPKKRWCCFC